VANTSISAVAVAAVLALAAPSVFAQPVSGTGTPPAMHTGTGLAGAGNTIANEIKPGQMLVSKLDGAAVYDLQQQKIGDVRNVVLDPDGRVAGIVINTNSNLGGNNGNRAIEVPMNALKVTTVDGVPQFMITAGRQQLASAPTFDVNNNSNGNRNEHNGAPAERMQPSQVLGSNLNGTDVYDAQNQKVGSVKDIVLDPNGQVAEVVLSTNGRNVAMPMKDLKIVKNNSDKVEKVMINETQAQLNSAAVFHLNPGNGG
jgi:sporulation protein YlmC with PRC-barrel domain